MVFTIIGGKNGLWFITLIYHTSHISQVHFICFCAIILHRFYHSSLTCFIGIQKDCTVLKVLKIRKECYRIHVNADFGSLQIGKRHVFGRSSRTVLEKNSRSDLLYPDYIYLHGSHRHIPSLLFF